MKYRYFSYGLRIASDFELPELTAVDLRNDPIDLRLCRSTLGRPDAIGDSPAWYRFTADESDFWWATVGRFKVSAQGDVVEIDPRPGIKDDLVAFPLLGPVWSEVLRRKGYFVLHASAVEIDGRGIAFMADKGTGKSSSCISLLKAGARILADDLVSISTDKQTIMPGFAQVKLDQQIVDGLDASTSHARPTVDPAIEKVRVLVPGAMAQSPAPVSRLYILRRGESVDPSTSDVPPVELIPAVVRYSYAVRFGRELLDGEIAAEHFRHAVATANAARVKFLHLPKGLERMSALYQLVRDDLMSDDPE